MQITAALLALPSRPIPLIYLLIVIPNEKYYRVTNNELTALVPRVSHDIGSPSDIKKEERRKKPARRKQETNRLPNFKRGICLS